MIKRVLVFLILSFFITFKCLTWVPSAAVSGIPAIDALEYTILQTIGMAAQNGIDMDFTGALADIIQDVNESTYSVEYGLKMFLKRFAAQTWDILTTSNEIEWNDLDYLISGISVSSGIDYNLLTDIIRQYDNKVLDNDIDVVTPITEKNISFWNKYRTDFINEYLERLNYDPDVIEVNPPEYYEQTVQRFSGFTALNTYSPNLLNLNFNTSANGGNIVTYAPFEDYSFVSGFSPYYQYYVFPLLTISINGADNSYTVSYPDVTAGNFFLVNNTSTFGAFNISVNSDSFRITDVNWLRYPPEYNLSSFQSQFTSLDDAVNYLYGKFSHINLYVNGTAWAYNSTMTSDFSGSVPNAVIDTSTDDGKIVSNPIYWVVDNNTGTPIDAQINLDKLAGLISSMIDGTRSDTTVGFDDLVDAGVIEKTDGTTITDADVGTRSIADVISDTISETGDISITGEIAGVIPPLPILPTFKAGPQGDPTAGFRGMSVLARIINVTNRGLPDDLIAMFYGIVACLIVLGLIKVLHK